MTVWGQDKAKFYVDEYGFPVDKLEAKYYRVINRQINESNIFFLKEYYLNDTLKESGSYLDIELYTKEGHFVLYYDNGQRKEECSYKNNLKIGKSIKWYRNGQLKEICHHNNSKDSYLRLNIESFFDSLGNQLVTHGNGEYILHLTNPLSHAKGFIKNGLKNGSWTGYFETGKVAYEEEYENNKRIKRIDYDDLGNEIKDKRPESNLNTFYKFVANNLEYPATARRNGIQGTVIVQILSESGKITKTRIVKGLGGGCDEEALRVINKFNNKSKFPIRSKSHPLVEEKPVSLYIPISFKLG